ncbi:MAG: DUF2157 domain-containing protein [Gammaproteobacteria bacterium]|nr:DUF2157 domain-containing protein [Gammaproteobacteria bacterium]
MTKQKLTDIPVTINRLKHIANALQLSVQTQQRVIELAGLKPDNAAWLRFIDRFLLICGVTLALVGVMSFFAYNWADLHKFGKFALIEIGIISLAVTAYFKTVDKLSGKAALFGAAVLTGVLLVVYGQTYQTGADCYRYRCACAGDTRRFRNVFSAEYSCYCPVRGGGAMVAQS